MKCVPAALLDCSGLNLLPSACFSPVPILRSIGWPNSPMRRPMAPVTAPRVHVPVPRQHSPRPVSLVKVRVPVVFIIEPVVPDPS
jgi:hypothetical protein